MDREERAGSRCSSLGGSGSLGGAAGLGMQDCRQIPVPREVSRHKMLLQVGTVIHVFKDPVTWEMFC